MQIIFNTVRHFVRFYKTQYFNIEKIERNKVSGEYVITFFVPRVRRLIVKSAFEIMKDKQLLYGFSPLDAAMIGQYIAIARYENLYKITPLTPVTTF